MVKQTRKGGRKNKYTKKNAKKGRGKTRKVNLQSKKGRNEFLKSKFEKLQCSPSLENNGNPFSCYSNKSLHKMRNLWNARHPDAKIVSNNSRQIWETLKNNMSSVCNTERCWMRQNFMKNNLDKEITSHTFAPMTPPEWKTNPYEWLSSVDILNVMKQYEKLYPCFEFMGPSPIDYDTHKMYGECVWEELCHFSLQDQIKKGKTKIGIIFNLDPHYKPGSHWVSVFININKKQVFFFDSNGDKPPRKIKKFINTVLKQSKNITLKGKKQNKEGFKYDDNAPTSHQDENTECGVYSLYAVIEQVKDKLNPMDLKNPKKKITDAQMRKLRKKYFNEYKKI